MSIRKETGFESYLKEVNRLPLLTPEDEKTLARRVRKGDRLARDQMIRSNLRLVVNIARQYVGRGIAFQDIVEEGNIGLLKAADRFDPEKDFKFSTYATWWIKQSIRRSLLNTSRTIRIPAYVVEMIAKWKTASSRLTQKLGRHPVVSEVAKEMDMPPEGIEMLKKAINTSYSSNIPISLDILLSSPRNSADVDDLSTNKTESFNKKFEDLLDVIEEREAEVLKYRYGLQDGRQLTLREIGQKLSLSRERVRQIEKEALRKLFVIYSKRKTDGG